MRTHEQRQHRECHGCRKVFSRLDNLRAHQKRHAQELNCSKCGKVFYKEDALNAHICTQRGGALKRPAPAAALPPPKRVKENPQDNYTITKLHETYNRKFQAVKPNIVSM